MPFYKVSEMAESHVAAQPMGRFKGLAGELMKVGFVTYPRARCRGRTTTRTRSSSS